MALALTGFVCSCQAESGEPEVEAQSPLVARSGIIDHYSVPCNPSGLRCQVADIADVGSNSFVIGYTDASGNLKYTYQGTKTGQEVAPFPKGTAVQWVRANTSKSWNSFGCDMNYFAVEVTDTNANPTNGGHGVFLDRFQKCGSTWQPMTRTLMESSSPASGRRIPAVATKGTPYWGDLLFVWNTQTGGGAGNLVGRVMRFRYQDEDAAGWTDQIPAFSTGSFSSDLIYNQHSNKWIVGSMNPDQFSYVVRNSILSSDDNALPTFLDQNEDSSPSDGHHTSVAYNPLSSDGSYVWWHQDGSQTKGVYVHDDAGKLIPTPLPEQPTLPGFPTLFETKDPPSSGNYYTVPVAQTYSSSVPYVFLMSSGIYGLRSIDDNGDGVIDKRWALLDEANLGSAPFAVRSLATETVALLGVAPNASLRVVVSDFPGTTQLATLWYDNGYNGVTPRVFYTKYEDERDVMYQKVQTSLTPGNGTWSGEMLVNSSLSTAKQILVENVGGGVLETVYIAADNTLNHTRETAPNADGWNGESLLTGAPNKAKQIATAWNYDGHLEVFYIRYPDGVLCHAHQTDGSFAGWSSEEVLTSTPTTARRMVVGANTDGRLEVIFTSRTEMFTSIPDNVLYHTIQTAPGSTTWTTPSVLNGPGDTAKELAIYQEWVGRLRLVYTRWDDDRIYDTWQLVPGVWNGPHKVGSGISAKQIAVNDCCGPLTLFFLSSSNDQAYYTTQTQAGAWPSTYTGAGPTRFKRLALNPEEVFLVGMDDLLYHARRNSAGIWNSTTAL
jgi:hypothetical protein